MKKIENIIDNCAQCQWVGIYASQGCNVLDKAGICTNAERLLLMTYEPADFDKIDIPDWCPLETYKEEGTVAPSPSFAPPTVGLCGLDWMAEPLTGYGGTEIDGRTYYTQDEALEAARRIGNGWRLPTKEEHVALAAAGSTWVDKGPHGLPGRWFGGNHDTDHEGSLFFEASGYRTSSSGGLSNVGTNGYAWGSSPSSASSVGGSYLSFGSSYVSPEYNYNRADGFPVRLVREVR